MGGTEVAKLVEAIVAGLNASGIREMDSWHNPERDIHALARRDYAPSLRKHLDRAGVDQVLHCAQHLPRIQSRSRPGWNWRVFARKTELSDEVFSQVSEYFRATFGVSLAAADLPARRKLNYFAGMIHFAKLRSTLLGEYQL